MLRKNKHLSADAARKLVVADLADQNLKKHIAAIHINNRLTLTQRKASNVLLHNAYEELLTARVHRIRVKDLAEAIGFNTHNLDPLKEALKTLARTVLEWNILDEDGAQEEWGATTLGLFLFCARKSSPFLRLALAFAFFSALILACCAAW
jgi:hypothetical protein